MIQEPFNRPILRGNEILSLIPQRDPIVLVDSLYGVDDTYSYTGLVILETNLFCKDGLFSECGLIEHIAQSAAARIGYIYKNKGETIPVGFIGSVDKMQFYTLPRAGDQLQTTLKVEQEVFEITMVSARVVVDKKIIAEGLLKIFLNKDV